MSAAPNSLSSILGIGPSGGLPLMSAVKQGLPLASLDRVVRAVAPADNSFAFRIIPRATLARRRRAHASEGGGAEGHLSPSEGAQVARLAAVWTMALDVWGGETAARRFMFDAHPLLHGQRPIDVVLDGELGRPVVEGILGRLQYGSAV